MPEQGAPLLAFGAPTNVLLAMPLRNRGVDSNPVRSLENPFAELVLSDAPHEQFVECASGQFCRKTSGGVAHGCVWNGEQNTAAPAGTARGPDPGGWRSSAPDRRNLGKAGPKSGE